jgi:hypothetical protein
MDDALPTLKLLHPEAAMVVSKLVMFGQLSTETITESLKLGRENASRRGPTGLYSRATIASTSCENAAWMSISYREKSWYARNYDVNSSLLDTRTLAGQAGCSSSSKGRRLAR